MKKVQSIQATEPLPGQAKERDLRSEKKVAFAQEQKRVSAKLLMLTAGIEPAAFALLAQRSTD